MEMRKKQADCNGDAEKASRLEWRCGKSKRIVMEMRKKQADCNGDAEKSKRIGMEMREKQADWNGDAEKASGFQALVNNLVWDNGYTEVVSGPTRGDALLDIYLI
jgi:hypothetical protein